MQPLGVFEFDVPLDAMTDREIDDLAGVIAESMMEQLEVSTQTDRAQHGIR